MTSENIFALKKATKKMFENKKFATSVDFETNICSLCPYNCNTCIFCWSLFNKFKDNNCDYTAPLAVFEVLINAYCERQYMPTFYFLRQNICSICKDYGVVCAAVNIGALCPSRYLVQMDTNENIQRNYHTDSKPWYETYEEEEYCGYNTSNKQYDTSKKLKPMLSIDGTKMSEIINKLFNLAKTEN